MFLLALFIGYAVVWIGIAGYMLYVAARLRAVERDLDALRGMREENPDEPQGSASSDG